MELSHQKIIFKETALYDESEAVIYVVSSLTYEQKEINASFRRTGKSEAAPVGHASFEFVVPQGVPIKISPAVGTVEPEKKFKVQVRFSPVLEEEEIKEKGMKIATQIMQAEVDKKYQAALQKLEKEKEEQNLGKGSKRAIKASAKVHKGSPADLLEAPISVSPPTPESFTKDSPVYSTVVTLLLRNYSGSKKKYKIPCYIASGKCSTTQPLQYNIQNTVFLEVECPTIKPPVIILSDSGQNNIDFGDVCVGRSTKRVLLIQNVTDERVDLSSSILDTLGPFTVKNALRSLNPSETLTLILGFSPVTGEEFYEVLEFRSAMTRLFLRLTGRGIVPEVQFPFEDELLDMGCIKAGEFCQKSFKLENLSPLDIDYSIKLDSKFEMVKNSLQSLQALNQELSEKKRIGPPNYNGFDVFDFVPVEGKIPAGGSKEIIVTFAPDHASDNFSDVVRIEFFRKDIVHSFQVIGQGKKKCVFVEGYDEMVCNTESLAFSPVIQYQEDDVKPPPVTLIVTLQSFIEQEKFITAKREIYLRSVTAAVGSALKKGGEFVFESSSQAVSKGFTIEPQKGFLEIGTKKSITISWTPPQGHNPQQSLESRLMLTLKGGDGTVQYYQLCLHGMVFQTYSTSSET